MAKFDDVVFKGIKVDFISLPDGPGYSTSPMYSITYEYMGTIFQGYASTNILTICRCLIAYFGMEEDDIELALKPVADTITEACKKLQRSITMKPLDCCKNCSGLNENGEFRNRLKCAFSCSKYALENTKKLYDEQKVDRGCSTCKYCHHVINRPSYITAEESVCIAGLECDTVLFKVKNCPKWVGKFEDDNADLRPSEDETQKMLELQAKSYLAEIMIDNNLSVK